MHVTLWLLLACGSTCTALSVFLPSPASRMRTVDIVELRRRRRLFEILAANTHPGYDHRAAPTSAVDRAPGTAATGPSGALAASEAAREGRHGRR
ncbi:hypothetical protein GCM10010274_26870 [Streptomyces lavendofoliae]|uniref:Secreted protein n=1 Tax=Streptomyces lavendofoliae TaxID=67314 RepID=A0A918HWK5_9ACTN|nr:hypothetical protein GCM10010274_26870 [Streptomyces lavendofoliae]